MYLASFDASTGGTLRQGCVHLPALPALDDAELDRWWETYARLVASVDAIPHAGVALRVSRTPDGLLDRALFVAAPARAEPELRRWLASFTRLGVIVAESVELPVAREAYDAIADDVPRLQCRVRPSGFGTRDIWLACDFRVAPLLDDLLAEADSLGYRITYQLVTTRAAIAATPVADARKHALRVRDVPGVPRALSELETRLAERLGRATALVEELLAVESEDAARWLGDALRRQFRARFGAMGFGEPAFTFADGACEEMFITPAMAPDASELPLDECCAGAVEDAERRAMLAWRPSRDIALRFARRAAPPPHEPPAEPAPVGGPPVTPSPGGGDFIFMSYRHADIARIAPILESLARRGWNVWFDNRSDGIPVSSEWTAHLEERIRACRLVLFFVTQSAIDSKFVRREIVFADAIDKPIVSVQLEDARLRHGMEMLLMHYQMLIAPRDELEEKIDAALRYAAQRSRIEQ